MCRLVEQNAHIEWKDAFTQSSFLVKYAVEGDKKKIEELLTVDLEKTLKRDTQFCYFTAAVLALAGMKEAALYWLEASIDQGYINYPFISQHDPFLEIIRGDKKFKQLLERVKYEWENFEV